MECSRRTFQRHHRPWLEVSSRRYYVKGQCDRSRLGPSRVITADLSIVSSTPAPHLKTLTPGLQSFLHIFLLNSAQLPHNELPYGSKPQIPILSAWPQKHRLCEEGHNPPSLRRLHAFPMFRGCRAGKESIWNLTKMQGVRLEGLLVSSNIHAQCARPRERRRLLP